MVQNQFIPTSGNIIAQDVSYDDYLEKYAEQHAEWVFGEVVLLSPVSKKHNNLTVFLITVLNLVIGETGQIFHEPMVMKPGKDFPGRQPDIQVVLNTNQEIITENEIRGAADLVIEIISPESHRRDRVEKFSEYEKAGVKEYWILDPVRKESLFYQRNTKGIFEHISPTENGIYASSIIQGFKLPVDIFWQDNLPAGIALLEWIEEFRD